MTDLEIRSETRSENDDPMAAAVEAVEELRGSVETFRSETDERLSTELRTITDRISGLETRLNRPGAAPETRQDTGDIETRAFASFLRHGREALSADEQRALQVGAATGGETLVPEQFLAELIRNLVLFSPMRQVARVTNVSGSTVLLPRRTAALTAGWVAEGAPSDHSQPTYGQHNIPVFEARVHTDVSNQLIEDAAFDVSAEIARDFAEEFGRLEGAAFVGGNGDTQPEGFLVSSDFDTDEAAASAIDGDDIIDLYHAVPSVFAGRGTWIMNRATMGVVRKLQNSLGQYLWQDSIAAGNPPTIMGRPVVEMPGMADVAAESVPIAFGDWSTGYRIFDRIGLSVLRDPFSRGQNSEVRFIARRRVGGQLVNAEAVRGLAMPE